MDIFLNHKIAYKSMCYSKTHQLRTNMQNEISILIQRVNDQLLTLKGKQN